MATGINSIEELDNMRLDRNGDYILLRSLDFNSDASYDNPANKPLFTTGDGWIQLSNAATTWNGTFDGDGYTISNLYINKAVTYNSFFGYCSATSDIKNVGFIDAWCSVYSYGGVLCGLNRGALTNVYATGYLQGMHQVGGLCGGSWYADSVILKCWTDVEVHGNINHVGGLVGYHHKGSIDQSYTLGDVYGRRAYIGCFIGENQSLPATITNCYARGDAHKTTTDASTTIGNFCGRMQTATMSDCYATGRVIYDLEADPTDKGGIGAASGGQYGGQCVWDTETSLQATTGSPTIWDGKLTVQMYSYSMYSSLIYDWDIAKMPDWVNEIWVIDDGNDYPVLSWNWTPPSGRKNKVKSLHQDRNTLGGSSSWC